MTPTTFNQCFPRFFAGMRRMQSIAKWDPDTLDYDAYYMHEWILFYFVTWKHFLTRRTRRNFGKSRRTKNEGKICRTGLVDYEGD